MPSSSLVHEQTTHTPFAALSNAISPWPSIHLNKEDRVEQAITGTTCWTTYTLDWHVPAESRGFIVFGASLQGPGQIWLQDVHLQTVEAS